MRIEQLQQIVEIRNQQSISKAARVLFMAQPSLSAILSNFEQEIGVQLFKRGPNGVTPTENGEDILEMIDQILSYVDQIVHYQEGQQALCGSVELLITQAFQFVMADILVEFKKRYPQATLNFRTLLPSEVAEEIAQGKASIGLTLWEMVPERGLETLQKRHIEYEVFGVYKMMLCTHPDHPLAQQSVVEPEALSDVQLVVHAPHYWSVLNDYTPLNKPPLVIKDSESLKRLISGGHAAAVMPELVARNDLFFEHDLIVQTPIQGKGVFGMGKEYLMYAKKKKFTPLEEGLLQIIRQILSAENR